MRRLPALSPAAAAPQKERESECDPCMELVDGGPVSNVSGESPVELRGNLLRPFVLVLSVAPRLKERILCSGITWQLASSAKGLRAFISCRSYCSGWMVQDEGHCSSSSRTKGCRHLMAIVRNKWPLTSGVRDARRELLLFQVYAALQP